MFCPKGCKGKYGGRQYMQLENDKQGLPKSYKCHECGHEVVLTFKQKILEIIYRAQWFFGVPEHCEVDEYYMEDENAMLEKLLAVIPSVKFVRHIATHLTEGQPIICKICNRTYDEIVSEDI